MNIPSFLTDAMQQVLSAVPSLLIVAVPAFFLFAVCYLGFFSGSARRKGKRGERIVNRAIKRCLDREQYRLIEDVTLPTDDGTTQIDHIVVSVFGVFVIETKNMQGWIFGKSHWRQWTQQIYQVKNRFQNPLDQNYKHVQTVKSLLGLQDLHVHPMVVFIGGAEFKTEIPAGVYDEYFISYIQSQTDYVLSSDEVVRIVDKIEKSRKPQSFKTNRAHVKHVKASMQEQTTTPPCPQCGSCMVVREAVRGKNPGQKFWGCPKFPECRGMRPL